MTKKKWTTDADGEYVRWNEPPHYVGGIVNLLLPGEPQVSVDELSKRRTEFLRLQWRSMTGKARKPRPRR